MGKLRNEFEGYNRDAGFDMKMTYDANNNVIYVGKAYPGALISSAVWQISKAAYDSNNNMTTLRWADKTDAFTKIWNNRADYDYSDI